MNNDLIAIEENGCGCLSVHRAEYTMASPTWEITILGWQDFCEVSSLRRWVRVMILGPAVTVKCPLFSPLACTSFTENEIFKKMQGSFTRVALSVLMTDQGFLSYCCVYSCMWYRWFFPPWNCQHWFLIAVVVSVTVIGQCEFKIRERYSSFWKSSVRPSRSCNLLLVSHMMFCASVVIVPYENGLTSALWPN